LFGGVRSVLDLTLAFTVHTVVADGGHLFSIIALIGTVVSRYMYGRLYL